MNFTNLPRWAVICLYAAAIGLAAILLVQHWIHLPAFLPYAILLACPLMHLFGHHHGHARRHTPPGQDRSGTASSP